MRRRLRRAWAAFWSPAEPIEIRVRPSDYLDRRNAEGGRMIVSELNTFYRIGRGSRGWLPYRGYGVDADYKTGEIVIRLS
jgi:hypothetical protein